MLLFAFIRSICFQTKFAFARGFLKCSWHLLLILGALTSTQLLTLAMFVDLVLHFSSHTYSCHDIVESE